MFFSILLCGWTYFFCLTCKILISVTCAEIFIFSPWIKTYLLVSILPTTFFWSVRLSSMLALRLFHQHRRSCQKSCDIIFSITRTHGCGVKPQYLMRYFWWNLCTKATEFIPQPLAFTFIPHMWVFETNHTHWINTIICNDLYSIENDILVL